MSHIDTLQVYKEAIQAGYTETEASFYANTLDNSFMTKVNELKYDFASQKLITILGGIIISIGIALVTITWNISVDIEVLKSKITLMENNHE